MFKLFAVCALSSFLVLASSCSRARALESASAPDAPSVAVAKASTENLSSDVVLTAEFKPNQEVDVMAKVAGYIKEIRVDVGDRVKENDLLATLEIPEMDNDLEHSRAAVKHSQAEVKRAEDEVRRAESAHNVAHDLYLRLYALSRKKPGMLAQQEIDDAQGKDLVAEAQVNAAKSALASSQEQVAVEQTSTAKVRTLIDYQRVTAPFAGVITRRYADKGSMIQAGTASQTQAMPVVRLSENTRLRLTLPVPESVVPTVHIGQSVEVHVPTLNRTFHGSVKRFSGKVSMATRTMDTEVDVENQDLVLMPGMYAEVKLNLARSMNAVAVPVTAVDLDTSASAGRVMVVTPNNRVEIRKVTIGLETANRIQIRSGLNAGDMVILAGRAALQSGEEVRPVVTSLTPTPTP